jgi:hypothetical protein
VHEAVTGDAGRGQESRFERLSCQGLDRVPPEARDVERHPERSGAQAAADDPAAALATFSA